MKKALGRVRRRGGDTPEPIPCSAAAPVPGSAAACPEVTITWALAADAPRLPAQRVSRAARRTAPAAPAAAVAATAIAVTLLGQGGPRGGPSPPPQPRLTPAQISPPPALAIEVVAAGCQIFVVKNVSNYVVLQAGDKPVPMGATLLFNEVPLYVQISNPACASVYVHGHRRPAGPAGSSWNFAVPR
jgi:hypothetical protein